MGIFINLSNHPSTKWDAAQKAAAGDVVDVPFPNVPAAATEEEVAALAAKTAKAVETAFGGARAWYEAHHEGYHSPEEVDAIMAPIIANRQVLVQGEFSLCAELWPRLAAMGFVPVVACSERVSIDNGDGSKTAVFKFVKFRRVRV